MKLIFDEDGYFCEGVVPKKWQFFMESGKIMLTKEKLSLIKQSNVSLTETGSSVDNFNEISTISFLSSADMLAGTTLPQYINSFGALRYLMSPIIC